MDVALPHEWYALCLLVLVLGMRHGFDADHLATIDGLTRFNASARPRLARFCGVLFSLGHGLVVVIVALAVSMVAARWQAPGWLQVSGMMVSVLVLVALGLLNLRAVLATAPDEMVRPVGVKSRMLGGLARTHRPAAIMAIGGLFAISFDTISQATLFALAAEQFGGWRASLSLGLLFLLGMFITDGINGLWISHLIRRADRSARIASRTMGLVVSLLSLAVAGLGIAKWTWPAVDDWSEGKELVFGLVLVGLVGLSFLYSMWLARRPLAVSAR